MFTSVISLWFSLPRQDKRPLHYRNRSRIVISGWSQSYPLASKTRNTHTRRNVVQRRFFQCSTSLITNAVKSVARPCATFTVEFEAVSGIGNQWSITISYYPTFSAFPQQRCINLHHGGTLHFQPLGRLCKYPEHRLRSSKIAPCRRNRYVC